MLETLVQLQSIIHNDCWRWITWSNERLNSFITSRDFFWKQMISLLFSSFQQGNFSFKLQDFFFKPFDNDCWICCFVSSSNVFNQGNSSCKFACWKWFLNMFWICMHCCNKSCFTVSSNRVSKHHRHHWVSIWNVNLFSFLSSFV